jgi:hypothetical protein
MGYELSAGRNGHVHQVRKRDARIETVGCAVALWVAVSIRLEAESQSLLGFDILRRADLAARCRRS